MLTLDGNPMEHVDELHRFLDEESMGKRYIALILRRGNLQEVDVSLDDAPEPR